MAKEPKSSHDAVADLDVAADLAEAVAADLAEGPPEAPSDASSSLLIMSVLIGGGSLMLGLMAMACIAASWLRRCFWLGVTAKADAGALGSRHVPWASPWHAVATAEAEAENPSRVSSRVSSRDAFGLPTVLTKVCCWLVGLVAGIVLLGLSLGLLLLRVQPSSRWHNLPAPTSTTPQAQPMPPPQPMPHVPPLLFLASPPAPPPPPPVLGLPQTQAPSHWFIASHHKTGTYLMFELVAAVANLTQPPMHVFKKFGKPDSELSGGHNYHIAPPWDSTNAIVEYSLIDATAWRLLVDGGRSFKLVHLIRDPLELVISGYWYHRFTGDSQVVPCPGCDGHPSLVYGNLSVERGLEAEAHAELVSTLPEISSTLQLSYDDPRVLTMGLEEFSDDFEGAVTRLWRFWATGCDEALCRTPLAQVLAAAAPANIREDPNATASVHVNTEQRKLTARALINKSHNEVWDKVRALRHPFRYEQQCAGTWRLKGAPKAQACL